MTVWVSVSSPLAVFLKSGKDLIQQVEQLRRSLSDAEAVSRDTKRDWAVLRSEKLGLQERVVSAWWGVRGLDVPEETIAAEPWCRNAAVQRSVLFYRKSPVFLQV